MKISLKIALIVASFHSLNMCMEKSLPLSQPLTSFQESSLSIVYHQTEEVLKGIPNKEISLDTFTKLLQIIDATQTLKKLNITEQHIGSFAYHKESRFPDKLKLLNPQTGHYYIAAFFHRLEIFNQSFDIKNLPTASQYLDFIHNIQKKNAYEYAITQTSDCGFKLSPEKNVRLDRPPFVTIPNNIAIDELHTLIKELKIICTKDLETIKTITELMYLNNSSEKTISADVDIQ